MSRAKKSLEEGRARRARIFAFILAYIEEKGIPPTIREIAEGSGISTTSIVEYHLDKLKKEGMIDRIRGTSRGIRIPDRIRRSHLIVYRCLYPFSCDTTQARPGSCPFHGTELIPFVSIVKG